MKIYGTDIDDNTLQETSPASTYAFPFRSDCTDLQNYPGKKFPWHWHSDVEILMPTSGKIELGVAGNRYLLEEMDIAFITPNVLHSTYAVASFPGIHKEFIFSPMLIGGTPESSIYEKYVHPLINLSTEILIIRSDNKKNKTLSRALNDVYDLYREKRDGYELFIRQLMDIIWMELREESAGISQQSSRLTVGRERIHTILGYLKENYCYDIGVADMAAVAGVSARECSRCFRTQLGTTPMEYLLTLRIGKACEMLQNGNYSIGEIAMNCGFSSSSYFSKQFRSKTGMSPRAYRDGFSDSEAGI